MSNVDERIIRYSIIVKSIQNTKYKITGTIVVPPFFPNLGIKSLTLRLGKAYFNLVIF